MEGGPGPGSVGSAWSRSSWPFVLVVLCAVHASNIADSVYLFSGVQHGYSFVNHVENANSLAEPEIS